MNATAMPAARPTRRLLLVRHGLPDYRGGQPGDLWPGPPLSDTGRAQATQAAPILRPFKPSVVHTSPLARTQQTAELLAGPLGCRIRADSDLCEWNRTERLHEVSVRLTRWLVRWLRDGEPCAVAVSHASPILAILRSALYLPHVAWHKTGFPDALEVSSADRFEVSMASVFELAIDPGRVTARCLFHPRPRILHARPGCILEHLPRPVPGHGENVLVERPNWLRLIGYRQP